jgi:hypothetical protein
MSQPIRQSAACEVNVTFKHQYIHKMNQNYITGFTQTPAGEIPLVSTRLVLNDYIGAIKVRWAINRNNYKVLPGLYGVGSPNEKSDVLVTANYKLSFDHVRKNLKGINAWILALDTKGINVWCAAGKRTFGSRELVYRIQSTQLEKVVSHKRIIVPQLGAVGVSAHMVKKKTSLSSDGILGSPANNGPTGTFKKEGISLTSNNGFNVLYGPVRASDIKTFLNNGYKATNEMRKVSFTFTDRLKLIPVDFVYGKKYLLPGLALILVLSGINQTGISFERAYADGLNAMLNLFLAYITGIVITPMLLPYIPGRPFALKGFFAGFALFSLLLVFENIGNTGLEYLSWFLLITALSSFIAMNFTGSSTFTSLSGVKKEMKIALPLQIIFAFIGLILFTIGKII